MTRLPLYIALALFGLMAGFFYAYSVSVMPGLDQAAPAVAVEAMQGINRAVRNPVFFVTFFLTPAVALGAAALQLRAGTRAAAVWLALAIGVYGLGAMLPTVLVNVPLNEALAAAGPPAVEQAWQDYAPQWSAFNDLRTGAALVALLFSASALRRVL